MKLYYIFFCIISIIKITYSQTIINYDVIDNNTQLTPHRLSSDIKSFLNKIIGNEDNNLLKKNKSKIKSEDTKKPSLYYKNLQWLVKFNIIFIIIKIIIILDIKPEISITKIFKIKNLIIGLFLIIYPLISLYLYVVMRKFFSKYNILLSFLCIFLWQLLTWFFLIIFFTFNKHLWQFVYLLIQLIYIIIFVYETIVNKNFFKTSINKIFLLFLIVNLDIFLFNILICLIMAILLFLTPISLYNNYRYQLQNNPSYKINNIMSQLKTISYKSNNNSQEDSTCLICLNTYKQKDKLIQLQCYRTHIFHITCIKQWIAQKITQPYCPTCRTDINIKNNE